MLKKPIPSGRSFVAKGMLFLGYSIIFSIPFIAVIVLSRKYYRDLPSEIAFGIWLLCSAGLYVAWEKRKNNPFKQNDGNRNKTTNTLLIAIGAGLMLVAYNNHITAKNTEMNATANAEQLSARLANFYNAEDNVTSLKDITNFSWDKVCVDTSSDEIKDSGWAMVFYGPAIGSITITLETPYNQRNRITANGQCFSSNARLYKQIQKNAQNMAVSMNLWVGQ